MAQIEEELHEYIAIPNRNTTDDDAYRWSHTDTLIFLDLYKVYRKEVGTLRIRSLKKMFDEISKEMRLQTGINITSRNCENRWRVLERAYKKYIIHNSKPGASRKDLYAEIMNEILGKKKNIFPEVLLSSETVSAMLEVCVEVEVSTEKECAVLKNTEAKSSSSQSITKPNTYKNKNLKCNLLKQIRQDRENYYNRRLEQEDRKIDEKVRKNRILEEKNDLLRQIINNNNNVQSSLDLF